MITLHAALATYPHIRALKAGAIASERVRMEWEEVEPITRAFRRQVRTGDFDLCEIALTTHAQARERGVAITALPVVVARGFHHGAMLCRADSPLRGPRDLIGKRVGVRAFSQTTGVWLRGILREEYDVDHRAITWVTAEDAHVLGYVDPPHVVRIAPGQDLAGMLMNGEIDAAIGLPNLDMARLRTVIPDAEAAAAAWFRKTGVYPINHVVCVKDRLLADHPWLASELYRMCVAAKAAATEPSAEARYRPVVGDDPLPYGLEANRIGIEFCLRYAAEQGLVSTGYRPEDLFVAL